MNDNFSRLPGRHLGLRRLGANAMAILILQAGAVVLGLGFSIFLARSLGPEGNGVYTLAILLPNLLSIFANLGIGPANVYFLGRGEYSSREVTQGSIFLAGGLSILGIGFTIPLLIGWGDDLFPNIGSGLLIVGLAIFPFMLAQTLLQNVFQGKQDFKRFNHLALINPVATLMIAFLLVGLFKLGAFGAVISYGLGQLVALLLALWLLKQEIFGRADKKGYIRACLGYGWKAHLGNILSFLNYRIDIFLMNGFLNPAAVGVYTIAVQIAERLWILSQAVSTVLLPRLAELEVDEDVRAKLTPLISRWILFVTTVVAIAVAVFAQPLIILFFGEAYEGSVGALLWLLPGIALGGLSKVLSNDVAARGRPELNLYTACVIILINVVCNILLIPRMGIEGAALATTIAYGVDAVLTVFLYCHLSKNSWFAPLVPSLSDLVYIRSALRSIVQLFRRI